MEVVNTSTTTDPVNMYNYLNVYLMNPMVFIIILLIIVGYYVFLGRETQASTMNGSSSGGIFGIIIAVVLVVLIFINAVQYFFSVNVTAYIQGLFTPKTTVDIVVDQSAYQPSPVPEIKFKKQVFNIPGNYYSYDNAKALCAAYGAELATSMCDDGQWQWHQ